MNDLIALIPEKYRPLVLAGVLAFPYITRAAHALYHGQGLVGAIKGVLFGTNTPAVPPSTQTPVERYQAALRELNPQKPVAFTPDVLTSKEAFQKATLPQVLATSPTGTAVLAVPSHDTPA